MSRVLLLSLPLLVIACGRETSLSVRNNAPEAIITAPGSGESFPVGAAIEFAANVADDLTPVEQLEAYWRSDKYGALPGTASVEEDTLKLLVTDPLIAGEHTITVRLVDAGGMEGSDSIDITIVENNFPEVAILSPAEGQQFAVSEGVFVSALVSDSDEQQLNKVQLSWGGAAEGSTEAPDSPTSSGLAEFFIANLDVGTYTLSLEATDSLGGSGTDSTIFQVVIGDLDGDNMMELMIDDNRSYTGGIGKYHCYNHDATPVPGWPLSINGSSFFHMPCWSDMDGNGFLDLICAGGVSSTANIYLVGTDVLYNPANIVNPVWQYNVRHDGLYPGETAPPELEVTLTPTNPPIIIPANGGTFEYSVNIENIGTGGTVFDAWIEADIPGGTTVSPIILRPGLNLGAGGVLFREMAQFVPAGAPAGNYTYRLAVGMYPNTVYDADEFGFSKE